jgi:serine/threonine kinase PknH
MAKMPTPTPPDPRTGVGAPVIYHTDAATAIDHLSGQRKAPAAPLPPPESDERPVTDSALWKKLKSTVLFWRAARDVVQVSVYGPTAIVPGETAEISVYLHSPEVVDSVRTLSRAFHHDTELIGSGFVSSEVARETPLAVHLSVANAGISKSLLTCVWHGPPQRLVFDLHVPWEAPSGHAPGVVSVGRDDVRVGKIDFRLNLLPRRG